MNKYQIVELKEKNQHAGSKAREDAARFAEEAGYRPLYIHCRMEKNDSPMERALRFVTPAFSWLMAFIKIKSNSVVFVQNPFYHRHLGREQCLKLLKSVKKCKIVSLIHDAECLRGSVWLDKNVENEFAFMKSNSDFEIVHNDFMKEAFLELGFGEEQLVPLEIFDYYTDKEPCRKNGDATADVIVAGNLNPKKSPYVYNFGKIKNKFTVNLYGPNYAGDGGDGYINYKGSYPSEEIPSILDGKFGLVWDGDSVDECSGETGRYLKVNNPHKTSLYLVSGHPAVIWKQAALSRFIEKENAGLCVDSLEELKEKIDSLSDSDYENMVSNVEKIAHRLKGGFYLKKALAECERRIEG